MRDSEAREYDKKWLQYERQQPMYDKSITEFYDRIFHTNPVHEQHLDQIFINTFDNWLFLHEYSMFRGLDAFPVRHVINGCTQFIDDLYQRCWTLQTFEKDYKYHWRLNNHIKYATIETLDPTKELLISMPFPYYGDTHPDMEEILSVCDQLDIPVHIDSAWISCIRDINFDFNHPAIQTVGISLSKGGLGGNRIGVRFARNTPAGAVTIMNDFNMNNQALMHIGIQFMNEMGPEYFWRKYRDKYFQVCLDFNLTPTKTIHLAKDGDRPVGVRSLLRAL